MGVVIVAIFLAFLTIFARLEFSSGAKRIPTFAGPFRVLARTNFNYSRDFNSEEKIVSRMRFTSPCIRSTQYVWGESHNALPLDDTFEAEVHISKWTNNQWMSDFFVMKLPRACSSVMEQCKPLMAYMFGDDGLKCPIPAGKRTTVNQTFNPEFKNFRVFPYGRWLFNLAFVKDKRVFGVLTIDGEAVPKL